MRRPEWWLAWFPVALRYGGLAGVAFEVLVEKGDRLGLLALLGGMMGVGEMAQAIRSAQKREGSGP